MSSTVKAFKPTSSWIDHLVVVFFSLPFQLVLATIARSKDAVFRKIKLE